MFGKKKLDVIFLSILLLFLLLFFKDALLGTRTLIYDAADYFYPIFFNVSCSLRHGALPLWNPFLFNGFPTIGNVETQVFYPINYLFILFTSFTPYAVYCSVILHFFLAGAFMYLLARHYLENRWACLMSAVVFMLSGFMVGHSEHVTIIEVLAWLPLVFLFLEKALQKKNIVNAVYAGFFFGMSILAGHPQTSHAMVFILFVHAIYRTATLYLKEKNRRVVFSSFAALAVCVGTGLLIAAVQLLPTYELFTMSDRSSALSFDASVKGGRLSFHDIIALVVPNYFGALNGTYWSSIDISQSIIYIGVAPLFLVGLAFTFARKRAEVLYFSFMAAFFFLLSFGENSPVYRLLYLYVPGFNFFRGPQNTFFLFTFCAALLSGYGLNLLMESVNKYAFYLYFALFFVVCLMGYAVSPNPPVDIAVESIRNMRSGLTFFMILLFLFFLVVTVSLYYPRSRTYCMVIVLLLTFTDFYLNFSNTLLLGLNAAPDNYEQQTDTLATIKNQSNVYSNDKPGCELNDTDLKRCLFRVYSVPRGLTGTQFVGYNRAMLFGTFLVDGFEPLAMSRHNKLITTLSVRNFDNLLKIMNVKYITMPISQNVSVSYYSYFLPRTFIVPNAKFINNDDRIMDELAVFDPASQVVIFGQGRDVVDQTLAAGEWSADVMKYSGSKIEIQTHSKKDGYLVLSDTFYPGWSARVDGVEYPVMRANFDFRAVSLQKGDHLVEFEFRSRYLMLGLAVSFAGILLVCAVLFYSRYFTIHYYQSKTTRQ